MFKAKLRKIGNSIGVIIPANVITSYNVGDEIKLDIQNYIQPVITLSIKAFIQDYKDARFCEICHENRAVCLQFHHKDTSTKKFNVGQPQGHTLDEVKKEMKKCIIICANCHFILHSTSNNDVITKPNSKPERDTAWLPTHRADKPKPELAGDCEGCKLLVHQQGKGMSCPAGACLTSIKSVFEQNVNPDSDCQVKEEAA